MKRKKKEMKTVFHKYHCMSMRKREEGRERENFCVCICVLKALLKWAFFFLIF